jgi:hypothetical protein
MTTSEKNETLFATQAWKEKDKELRHCADMYMKVADFFAKTNLRDLEELLVYYKNRIKDLITINNEKKK